MDSGILTDSSLEHLAAGDKLPNLKNLQLTDPDNDFTAEAVLRFLKAAFAQRLSLIHIKSVNEISASDVQKTLDILSEARQSGQLKEADIVFDYWQSRPFARLVKTNPSGFRVYSASNHHRITKMRKNPLIQALRYTGSRIRTSQLIHILESAPGMEFHPSLVRFVRREGKDGKYMSSLPDHAERVAEVMREGRMTDAEAGAFRTLVHEYGNYKTQMIHSCGIWFLCSILLLAASYLCFILLPAFLIFILLFASPNDDMMGLMMFLSFTMVPIVIFSALVIFAIGCFLSVRVVKVLYNGRMSGSKLRALIFWTLFLSACASAAYCTLGINYSSSDFARHRDAQRY